MANTIELQVLRPEQYSQALNARWVFSIIFKVIEADCIMEFFLNDAGTDPSRLILFFSTSFIAAGGAKLMRQNSFNYCSIVTVVQIR